MAKVCYNFSHKISMSPQKTSPFHCVERAVKLPLVKLNVQTLMLTFFFSGVINLWSSCLESRIRLWRKTPGKEDNISSRHCYVFCQSLLQAAVKTEPPIWLCLTPFELFFYNIGTFRDFVCWGSGEPISRFDRFISRVNKVFLVSGKSE